MEDSYDRTNMPAEPSTPMGSGLKRRKLSDTAAPEPLPGAEWKPPGTPEALADEADPSQSFGMQLMRRRFDTGFGRRRL